MKYLYLILTTFLILITGCSKEEDVFDPKNPDNYKLTIEEIDPTMDSDFIITKDCKLLQDREIYDSVNDIVWKYNIFLPPTYDSRKTYPVLYLLHGMGSSYDHWIKSMNIKNVLEYFYSNGYIDLIIVTPDAKNTYYLDGYQDNIKYETFFRTIFVPQIEEMFPVAKDRSRKFIGGWSMGGYGAIYYSLKYSGDFSFCYAMSAPVEGRTDGSTPSLYPWFEEVKERGNIPYIILDEGDSDTFLQANFNAHWWMIDLSIPHEMILREGGHDRQFWSKGIYFMFDRLEKFVNNTQP